MAQQQRNALRGEPPKAFSKSRALASEAAGELRGIELPTGKLLGDHYRITSSGSEVHFEPKEILEPMTLKGLSQFYKSATEIQRPVPSNPLTLDGRLAALAPLLAEYAQLKRASAKKYAGLSHFVYCPGIPAKKIVLQFSFREARGKPKR